MTAETAKPCGYCKRPKTAHRAKCPYGPPFESPGTAKPRRSGHKKRTPVKKGQRGVGASVPIGATAVLRAEIEILDGKAAKLREALAVLES